MSLRRNDRFRKKPPRNIRKVSSKIITKVLWSTLRSFSKPPINKFTTKKRPRTIWFTKRRIPLWKIRSPWTKVCVNNAAYVGLQRRRKFYPTATTRTLKTLNRIGYLHPQPQDRPLYEYFESVRLYRRLHLRTKIFCYKLKNRRRTKSFFSRRPFMRTKHPRKRRFKVLRYTFGSKSFHRASHRACNVSARSKFGVRVYTLGVSDTNIQRTNLLLNSFGVARRKIAAVAPTSKLNKKLLPPYSPRQINHFKRIIKTTTRFKVKIPTVYISNQSPTESQSSTLTGTKVLSYKKWRKSWRLKRRFPSTDKKKKDTGFLRGVHGILYTLPKGSAHRLANLERQLFQCTPSNRLLSTVAKRRFRLQNTRRNFKKQLKKRAFSRYTLPLLKHSDRLHRRGAFGFKKMRRWSPYYIRTTFYLFRKCRRAYKLRRLRKLRNFKSWYLKRLVYKSYLSIYEKKQLKWWWITKRWNHRLRRIRTRRTRLCKNPLSMRVKHLYRLSITRPKTTQGKRHILRHLLKTQRQLANMRFLIQSTRRIKRCLYGPSKNQHLRRSKFKKATRWAYLFLALDEDEEFESWRESRKEVFGDLYDGQWWRAPYKLRKKHPVSRVPSSWEKWMLYLPGQAEPSNRQYVTCVAQKSLQSYQITQNFPTHTRNYKISEKLGINSRRFGILWRNNAVQQGRRPGKLNSPNTNFTMQSPHQARALLLSLNQKEIGKVSKTNLNTFKYSC